MENDFWKILNKQNRDKRVLRMWFGKYKGVPICETSFDYLYFLKLNQSFWKTLDPGQKCCITQTVNASIKVAKINGEKLTVNTIYKKMFENDINPSLN